MIKFLTLTKKLLILTMAIVCLTPNAFAINKTNTYNNTLSFKTDSDDFVDYWGIIYTFITREELLPFKETLREDIQYRLSGHTPENIQAIINNIEYYQYSDPRLNDLDKNLIQQITGMLEQEKKIAKADLFLKENCNNISKQKNTALTTKCTKKQEDKVQADRCMRLHENLMNLKIGGLVYEKIDGKKRYFTDTEIKEKQDLIQRAICQYCYDDNSDD